MNALLEKPAPDAKAKTENPAKKIILLVDDDPAIRQILVRLLAEEDYLVLSAANGAEALSFADAAPLDLVLLDLNMPVKDGWQTFEELSFKHPELPFILITARPNQLFPAMASGVGALLEKPLDFAKLFSTIHSLLEEPVEMRLARLAGRSIEFRYVPPVTNPPERRAHSK